MKIINTIKQISNIYSNGSFDIKKWKEYINSIDSEIEELCISDMKETIDTGLYTFEKNFLPILNLVINEQNKLEELTSNFNIVTKELENKIISKFNKTIDVEIVLYLGLCDGAGWVVTIDNKTYCLLGIEKILELNWYNIDALYGLIYHELGHVYQNQYGVLERDFDNNKHRFLWQLFTGGIAAYNIAKNNGAEGWELFGWTMAGIVGGGVIGGALGAGVGALVTKATGVIGLSITKYSIIPIKGTTVL